MKHTDVRDYINELIMREVERERERCAMIVELECTCTPGLAKQIREGAAAPSVLAPGEKPQEDASDED
jgi:hypothetical protein